jgi:hypothetical protein
LGWSAIPDGYFPKDEMENAVGAAVDDVFGAQR